MPRAELVCVGSELLAGKVNTHASWLAPRLREAGLSAERETTVLDSLAEVRDAAREAARRSSAVILCGGLGPTFDDLTREGVAEAFGRELTYSPELFALIRRRFARYKLKVPSSNRRQAWVIGGARVLPNPNGSAPGQLLTLPGIPPKTVALLPGPFAEMAPMFMRWVLPVLRRRYSRGLARGERIFRFFGISEAAADMRLKPLLAAEAGRVDFTILAGSGLVELSAGVTGSAAAVRAAIARVDKGVRRLMGPRLWGFGGDTLEGVAGRRLRSKRWTLAAAESCTGGLLGARVTSVPGSSDYFRGSVVAYDNGVKLSHLGVPAEVLRRQGAVSEECARAMAEGVRGRLGADVGVSITGVAGPGGGTRAKPVGLVYISVAAPGGTRTLRNLFSGNRALVRERAVNAALIELLRL